jgi:hypothetical protein
MESLAQFGGITFLAYLEKYLGEVNKIPDKCDVFEMKKP